MAGWLVGQVERRAWDGIDDDGGGGGGGVPASSNP